MAGTIEVIEPNTNVEPKRFFYQKVMDKTLHPTVRQLLNMSNVQLAKRYCSRHRETNETVLLKLMNAGARYYRWGGADLMRARGVDDREKMIVIEMNSCPSGNKSVPFKDWEFEGFRRVMKNAFVPLLSGANLPEGDLAVFYDVKKQAKESLAYAKMLAELTNEKVYLVDVGYGMELPAFLKWTPEGVCQLEISPGEWREIRAVFRYVTRRPWVKIPLLTKTLVLNPVLACLAGGRNKLLAAKAYAIFNDKYADAGLQIHIPLTITDVTKQSIPKYAQQMNNQLVVKVPYSNCGVGVYTITSERELQEFMEKDHVYDKFVVQGLISHKDWPTSTDPSQQLHHVGCRPKCDTENVYVNDLRFMICSGPDGWLPVAMYSRRSAAPLTSELTYPSWEMLGTNLSMGEDGTMGTDTSRLLLLDEETFPDLGLQMDDLVESYVQTVLAATAVEDLCQKLMPPSTEDHFNLPLFLQLDEDRALMQEIARGCTQIMESHPELFCVDPKQQQQHQAAAAPLTGANPTVSVHDHILSSSTCTSTPSATSSSSSVPSTVATSTAGDSSSNNGSGEETANGNWVNNSGNNPLAPMLKYKV